MSYIQRLLDWLMADPTLGLLLISIALVLLSLAMARSNLRLLPFLRGVVGATIMFILLLGLLWVDRAVLRQNTSSFDATHGQLSDTNQQSAQSIWGKPHIQRELEVAHYIEKTEQQEVPNADPTKPKEYKDVIVRVDIPENTIIGFKGTFDMSLNEREKGYALYNGFVLDAQLEYSIVNDSDVDTLVDFIFPLSQGQKLYENFSILVDNKDINSDLRYGNDLVSWKGQMTAHQKSTIKIVYRTRGMDYFYYQIPTQRAIKNFSLTLTVDRLPTTLVNYPDGILSPTKIVSTSDSRGSILTWDLDQAITTAGMGIALPQPEQRGALASQVLNNGEYGLMLMVVMVSLTVIILGQPLNIVELALLAGGYTIQHLIIATVSDLSLGFWGSLLLGAAVAIVLAFLLFRRYPSRLLRILVMVLVILSVFVYPLLAQIGDNLNIANFDNVTRISVLLYLFGLIMYARSRGLKLDVAPIESVQQAA